MKISLLFAVTFIAASFSVSSQTVDAKGLKQGYWKKKDEKTNKLLYEGEFKDNKPVGKFKYYYPNDSAQAIFSFRNDGKFSYAWLFHPTGKKMAEGKYINEYKGNDINRIKDSVWTYYDDAGIKISKESYVNGKKSGTSYVYFPDGTLSEERNYKDGVENGPFRQYFDGKAIRGMGNYVNGNLDGKNVYYFPGGIEAAVGYYKNGKKIGPWIYRDSKGNVKERELYKDGVPASQKETEAFFKKSKTESSPAGNDKSKQGQNKK
jgi:antitoxin component YwqK of YwqJK toxin-antitoxin module